MGLPHVERRMHRALRTLALASVLLLLAPLGSADVQQGVSIPGSQAGQPQLLCALVQNQPRAAPDYARCDAEGAVSGATVLKVRVEGIGRAFAFVRDEGRLIQVGVVDCVATAAEPVKTCSALLSPRPWTSADGVLHVLGEGPGSSTSLAWVEKAGAAGL